MVFESTLFQCRQRKHRLLVSWPTVDPLSKESHFGHIPALDLKCWRRDCWTRAARVFKTLWGYEWGFKEFILWDFFLSQEPWLLSEYRLNLVCKVNMVQRSFHISHQRTMTEIQVPRHTMADELGDLLEKSLFTDCYLLVAGQEFRAHKSILAACSPVYRTLFQYDMKESRTKHVCSLWRMLPTLIVADWTLQGSWNPRDYISLQLMFQVFETLSQNTMVCAYPHLVSEAYSDLAFTQFPFMDTPVKGLKTS